MLTFENIERAAKRLDGHLLDTPCVQSRTLSQLTGAQVFLKFENPQYTASFKERGACNKLAQLSSDERHRGVIAMSAGNHAQGVAYHVQRLGTRAIIVMPASRPGTHTRIWCQGSTSWRHAGRTSRPRAGDAEDLARPWTRHGAGGLARITVSVRDVPGSLARITATVAVAVAEAEAGANIDEVHHQRAFTMLAAQNVEIEMVIQTRGREHIAQVLAALTDAGFEASEQH